MKKSIAGINNCEADYLWECGAIVWQKAWGGWPYTSVDRLCKTIQQWGYVNMGEKNSLQTARELCQCKSNTHQTAIWSDRNRLGWIWSGDQIAFSRSKWAACHTLPHTEIVSIAHRRRWNLNARYKKGSCLRIIWRDCIPRALAIHAAMPQQFQTDR